jgi:drug/metabolite transporter (DMT)-like permease
MNPTFFKHPTLRGHALASFTAFFWGITFICTKHLGLYFSSLEILFIRYLIAYALLWCMHPHALRIKNLKQEGMILLCGLTGALVYQYLENLSVSYTTAASVSFICAITPICTALLAWLFLKERVRMRTWLGMAISLIGVFFICFGDAGRIETGLMGDLIMLGGIWLWSVYSVLIKKVGDFGYAGLAVTRRIFFYALVFMLPFMIKSFGTMPYGALTRLDVFPNLLFLGAIASAICFSTWNRSVDLLGATTTSLYLFATPLITLVAELIYARSLPGFFSLLGMGITLVGLGISELSFKKRTQSKNNS